MRVFNNLILISLLAVLAGCSRANDTAYLTPIPEATIKAYRYNTPIETKLQAAIAAQAWIRTTRLYFDVPPRLISVDKLSLEEANQRVRHLRSGETFSDTRPGDTDVWLVMLEGEWRVAPPGFELTPEPLARGCAFILLDPDGGHELGTFPCPE